MEALIFDTELFESALEEHHAPQGLIVTFGVVAVARVASEYEHTVSSEFKSTEDEGGFDAAAAHNADGTYVGSTFHP